MKSMFKIKGEYIELVKLIKLLGWGDTGGQAKIMIDTAMVAVDGKVETRKKCKIRPGQTVTCNTNSVTIEGE